MYSKGKGKKKKRKVNSKIQAPGASKPSWKKLLAGMVEIKST